MKETLYRKGMFSFGFPETLIFVARFGTETRLMECAASCHKAT